MNTQMNILQYIQNIKNGDFTVEEFLYQTFENIEKFENKLHAYISINKDNAIFQAKKIDAKIKSDEKVGLCMGLPMSIKDNICIRDIKTTCGSKLLKNFVPVYDATVISKLKHEHAIFIGKTNMDEFAMGSTTEFSSYGPSKNPWNQDYVPGGSSGGSAVSVSALECLASLGSDTGGSIRNPSSFCSVVGLKPTYGLISRFGLISYSNSMEQIGPITRTVKDAAFLLNIISGIDRNDNTTICNNGIDYLDDIDLSLQNKKIAVISEMVGEHVDKKIINITHEAISKFKELGVKCEFMSLNLINYSLAAYYIITSTEAGSNLARFDNILYGEFKFGIDDYDFNTYISKIRKNFGKEVIRRMIIGGFVPSEGYIGRYFNKAIKLKNILTLELNKILNNFDVILSPTVPILPFKFGEKMNPLSMYLIDLNTVLSNLTGTPAISVPFKIVDGLPIGIQLITKSMNEKLLLQFAYALEKISNVKNTPMIN